tara:strand:- start:54 stop:185 length:132 start_codon:yes stop_codon:yes gene_type:complete
LNRTEDEGWEIERMTPTQIAIPEEKGIIAACETALLLKPTKGE